MLYLRSRRYANSSLRVGRLLVVFRGEIAEVPDWAQREYAWALLHVPGLVAHDPMAATRAPEPSAPVPDDVAEPAEPAEDAPRPRPSGRRNR